jgi:hypothetical protein
MLILGAVGQAVLWGSIFPRVPSWIVFVALVPPWLTVYTTSFCRQPPFGPRPLRFCLLFAMCWYGLMTAGAEVLLALIKPAPARFVSHDVARIMIYGGALSFAVFIRTIMLLRRYENPQVSDMEMYRQLEPAKPDRSIERVFATSGKSATIGQLMCISGPLSSCSAQTVRHKTDTSRAHYRPAANPAVPEPPSNVDKQSLTSL